MRWLILLLCLPLVSGLEWSEIMFDAEGNDNGKEFVELTGTENLAGCTITDTHSSDVLTPVQNGTDVILIIEEDGSFETEATIYHAGKAIGNGLGNMYEELTIACDDVLLTTSYNMSVTPGNSIVYEGTWKEANSTPGSIPKKKTAHDPTGGSSFCNMTLLITVNNSSGYTGDIVEFSVIGAGYASFTAEANGTVILEGDTLTRDSYSLTLPETDVILTAFSRECDAKQRAKRKILVFPKPIEKKNMSVNTTLAVLEKPSPPEPMPLVLPELKNEEVIYDEDENIVPWVCSFGIVTLLVSAALFWYESSRKTL